MRDIDAQLMMEAYGKTGAADPETGERMSPKAKAKAVQWTKDIKAKLAQAQQIGDSKEANKLQRYLDMHGIDEDNNGAIASSGGDRFNSPDDQYYNIGTDADGAELEQGHIVQYDPTGAHQSDPQVSDAQWIVSGAAVAGPDNEDMVDIIQLGKDISVPAKHLLVQSELGG
jgi:hypothetical protein